VGWGLWCGLCGLCVWCVSTFLLFLDSFVFAVRKASVEEVSAGTGRKRFPSPQVFSFSSRPRRSGEVVLVVSPLFFCDFFHPKKKNGAWLQPLFL
jgi:hypothetical protein